MLERLVGEDVEVRLGLDAGNPTVNADPHQLEQVLMNLCTNAAHAMELTGGVLEVGLTNVTLGPGDPQPYPDLEPGGYVRLTVTDTGHGIESAVMQKIFEPYFTTKSSGTGLGLAIARRIITAHGGHLQVNPRPGNTVTIQFQLPLFSNRHTHSNHGYHSA